MRLTLNDLPPKMRAQAEKQIAEQEARKKKSDRKRNAIALSENKKEFDSRGEYEYYMGQILPKLQKGIITECKKHPAFVLYEKDSYKNIKLSEIRYTPDFQLIYTDGSVEIVEIKSKFVKRMQRDYHIRRRIFIEKYARPFGWSFTEVITDDTKNDLKTWNDIQGGR